jgi:hypothetical protein
MDCPEASGQGRAAAGRPPDGVRGKLLAADEHCQAAPLNDCLRDSDEYRAIIRNLLHLGKISYGLARSPSPSTLPRRSGSPAASVPEF